MRKNNWFRDEWESARRTIEYCSESIELEPVNLELGELAAHHLLLGAKSLGGMINLVDLMAKVGWKAILDESEAYETIMEHGEAVMVALRVIAMRLDRSGMSKTLEDVLPKMR